MSEKTLQAKVIKKLEAAGLYVVKMIQTNKNGIPDLMAFYDNIIIFVECKSGNKLATKLQAYRMQELCYKGAECFVINEVNFNDQLKEIYRYLYAKKLIKIC